MLDPGQLGWTEFWLRVAVIIFAALMLVITLMIVAKVFLLIFDATCWLVRKRQEKDESEMDEGAARRALLNLIPEQSRARGARLLRTALATRHGVSDGPVYVSEYDGYPSRVHLDATAAQGVCAELLRAEPGDEPRWDWFPDEDGWIMRYVNSDSDAPGPLLGGRVTRTEVEV